MWESEYYADVTSPYYETYLADGCIALVVSLVDQSIVWGGFSKAAKFEEPIYEKYLAFKFKPGAFYALTGVESTVVMDTMRRIEEVDNSFDTVSFFELSYEEMKHFLIDYFVKLARNIKTMEYIQLFNNIHTNHISNTRELYEFVKLSPRQIQRQFKKHYGLTPQMVLSIIKFQHCVAELLYERSERAELRHIYYDQSKFNNEFKKNLGITPVEFVKLNKMRKMSF